MKQLTKDSLATYIRDEIQYGLGFHFDPTQDGRQVLGSSLEAHQDYGRFRALLDLAKEFGIDPGVQTASSLKRRSKAPPSPLARDLQTLRGYGRTERPAKGL